MLHAIFPISPRKSYRLRNVSLSRACIGVLGLFPMITASLVPIVGSLAIAAVVAALGAATFLALFPRGGQSRS